MLVQFYPQGKKAKGRLPGQNLVRENPSAALPSKKNTPQCWLPPPQASPGVSPAECPSSRLSTRRIPMMLPRLVRTTKCSQKSRTREPSPDDPVALGRAHWGQLEVGRAPSVKVLPMRHQKTSWPLTPPQRRHFFSAPFPRHPTWSLL